MFAFLSIACASIVGGGGANADAAGAAGAAGGLSGAPSLCFQEKGWLLGPNWYRGSA